MQSPDIYYIEEKKYASNRLSLLLVITFFTFVFSEQINGGVESNIFLVSLTLGGLTLISMMQYLYLTRYPYYLVTFRKNSLIFLDLVALTLVIAMAEQYGLFLFPLYIIIVMQSGLSLGIDYFYTSIILATLSWLALLKYSMYWFAHYDIIATFAVTTFLIPLFYLNNILEVHVKNGALEDALSTVSYDANYDTLTGVGNRKTYNTKISAMFKTREFFALLFIDLNKFKEINDKYGHHFGDEVLKEVARLLSSQLGEGDFIARLGGDEFAIITQKKKVFLPKFLERLEQEVIREHTIENITVLIELSIGVSMCPDDHKDEVMLGKYADEAMYAAKKSEDVYHVFYETIAPDEVAEEKTFI